MHSVTPNGFVRLLEWLTEVVQRRPRWFFYGHAIAFLLCLLVTVQYLEFDPSRNSLVGAKKKYHQNFLRFKHEFPTQDDLVVVVESEDREKNRQFVERLGAKLEVETNLFTDVFYKGNLKMLGPKALLFVGEADLAELDRRLQEALPLIRPLTQTSNLVSLCGMVTRLFRTAGRTDNGPPEALLQSLPALERLVHQAADSVHRPGIAPSPGIQALFGAGAEAEQAQYLAFADGRLYLVSAQAPTEALNYAAVERLRALVNETRNEVPGVNVGLTGEPVLEYDEMRQSQRDTAQAGAVALVLCALIFIYGYRETGRPLKGTICLVVGLVYTLAFATVAVGHLNILTITFLPILIGLAIDFAVHLITRYEEELRSGQTESEALRRAMVHTGQGIFSGAFTTAGAFLAMGLTDFKGIQEMGLISGGGLLICLIPMLTLLPVLLLRGRQNVLDHTLVREQAHRARVEQLWLRRPVAVLLATAGVCLLAVTQFPKVYFDYNLLNMQTRGLAAVEFEKKLIQSTPRSVLFAAVIADSLEEAAAIEARVKTLPTVAEVESLAPYLTGDQTGKLRRIGQIKRTVADLSFAEADPAPVDLAGLSASLWTLQGLLGLASGEAAEADRTLGDQLQSLREAIVVLRQRLWCGSAEVVAERLGHFQRALFADLHETFRALQQQDDSAPMRLEDLPAPLRNRFVGVTGKFLVQVYPAQDVWQRENQRAFIRDLRRTLDPRGTNHPVITGTPVQLYEYTTLLKTSYQEAAGYALAAIALLVFAHFRKILWVLLALVPVGVGSVWLGGLMGWRDIPFNPANIMTLPLVIGIGVTNGIHILNRFAEDRDPGILARSTGKAVLVSGMTTMAGFGSLTLAEHLGIWSLGYVMTAGVGLCMLAGLTVLPALLQLLRWRENSKKQPSAEHARSALGREEPR